MNNGIKVSQIGISGYFKHRDYEISEIYPWCFSGLPQGLLELSSDLSIKLDGNKVGKITKGGGVFEWLGILVNEFKVVPLRQWTKVEFNNNLLSEDLALSMLFLYHAHCTD